MVEPKLIKRSTSFDYAFGYSACLDLASGKFDRSGKPYSDKPTRCPDSDKHDKDGKCPSKFSATNPDTLQFVASGIYFSDKCFKGKNDVIPRPESCQSTTWTSSRIFKRTCDESYRTNEN